MSPSPADMAARPHRPLTARPIDESAHRPVPPADPMPKPKTPSEFVLRYTAAVLADPGLHRTAKRIGLILADRADPYGRIRDEDQLGVRTLAAALGIGPTAARTQLDRLCRGGWIRRTPGPEGQPARVALRIPGPA